MAIERVGCDMKQEHHISVGKACVQCYLCGFEQLISKRITRIKNIVVSILSLKWTLFLGKASTSYIIVVRLIPPNVVEMYTNL